MGTEAAALRLVHARSRAARVADLDGDASTPRPPRPAVTVPFLWEEAPGKPKTRAGAAPPEPAPAAPAAAGGEAEAEAEAEARPVPLLPLKLPPRLQVLAASSVPADPALSPETVLRGPYGCAKRPPRALRRSGTVAAFRFRRTPSAGAGFFSRRKAVAPGACAAAHGGHDPDASCCSPTASSASSSSSSSLSYFGDLHGHGDHRRPAEGRANSEDDDGAQGSVRITRLPLRRNRSLPSMATSHLWASIRKSVRQISPWS